MATYHDLVAKVRSEGTNKFIGDMNKAGKSVENFNKATVKTKKSGGAAGQAIINLGRGASDARYGFHGLANNLEATVELLGATARNAKETGVSFTKQLGKALIGPAGLVAAISILIAYGPEIVSFFQKAINPSTKLKEEVEKLSKELDELRRSAGVKTGESIEDQLIKKWDEIIDKQEQYIKSLKENKGAQTISVGGSTVRVGQNPNQDVLDLAILQQDVNKAAKENDVTALNTKKTQKEANTILGDTLVLIRRGKEIREEEGKSEKEILQYELDQLKAIDTTNLSLKQQDEITHRILLNSLKIKNIRKEEAADLQGRQAFTRAFSDFASGGSGQDLLNPFSQFTNAKKPTLDKLQTPGISKGNNAFTKGGPIVSTGEDSPFDQKAYLEIINNNKLLSESYVALGDTISSSLANSGNAFSTFVAATLQGLARYIVATKTANAKVIALRKAGASADAIKAASDTAAAIPGVGAFLLPALIGAALAAVSSAFSGGGGGGGGVSRSVANSSNIGLKKGSSIPRVQSGMNVEKAKIEFDGQDLVLALETAQYDRRGLGVR